MKYMFFFTFFPLFVLCQEKEINGILVDEFEKPISLANIQLKEKNTIKTISFTQSNENGFFKLKTLENSFPLVLKITHISFETKEIEIENANFLNILLENRTTTLNEIILKNDALDIIEKGDTLKYNLEKLLVGSELKLKDVLEKLPGLSIDVNGKIRYNGATIDNLLIDGDEFFRGNHQLATENLTAEMIETIELLKNYQDLSSIKGFENNGQIAVNIGLKKSFKDTFKGNFDAEGGVKERYKLHSNLFNFGGKNKINIITDANNLNESVFSPFDYIELRKFTGKNMLKDKITIGMDVTVEKDIPPFIFAEDNINSINTKNNTINFAKKINKNKRFEFISILNSTKQTENNNSLQTFFDGQSSTIKDSYASVGLSLFTSNFFKFENKINEKSYLESNAYLFYNKDEQNQNLNNLIVDNQTTNLFNNKINIKSSKFGFNTLYKNKLSDKILFESAIFNDYNFSDNNKTLNSNTNFSWFNFNQSEINQLTDYKSISLGIKAKTSIKLKNSNLDVKFLSSFDNENLANNNVIGNNYNFDNSFSLASNSFSVLYSSDLSKKIKYTASLDYSINNQNFSFKFNEKIDAFLPSINLSYQFFKKLSFSIGYSTKLNNPTIYNFITGNLIENYRTEIISNDLIGEKLLTDTYTSGFNYIDISKSFFSNFNVSFSNNRKIIGTNFFNTNFLTQQKNEYIDFGNSFILHGNVSKKFKKIPLGLNFSINNSILNNQTISNNNINENRINQNDIDFGLRSYFKNKINFNLGIKQLSNKTIITSGISTNSNRLATTSPFFNLDGTFLNKKVIWKINTTYYNFDSTFSSSNDIFDLGFKINYIHNTNISLYLHGNNVANIRENITKNNLVSNSFSVQETLTNTLSGFINIGLIFSF